MTNVFKKIIFNSTKCATTRPGFGLYVIVRSEGEEERNDENYFPKSIGVPWRSNSASTVYVYVSVCPSEAYIGISRVGTPRSCWPSSSVASR